METVREIEHESCHDHNREQQRDVFHLPRQSFDVSGGTNVSNLSERKVNWGGRSGDRGRFSLLAGDRGPFSARPRTASTAQKSH
ncbi:hypothetical protein GCM10010326_43260 [Streptomyces xanthochromogenes]|uniref:Uncharacterized protein n=1 Tax=Streptomyces xanthochromogenes TaxID=67384 RepID=A0ABQ3AB11_9ACTN|nr:hypothetical protein GCM10010326_43260 [Streptomyces xanthochromogenes]